MSFTRRKNDVYRELSPIDLDIVAAIAATTTFPLCLMERAYRISAVELEVPGGYAADPANFYVIALKTHAGVTLASWSTQTAAQGALTTLVFAAMVLAATTTGIGGDQLDIVCTKNGTAANLPAQTRVRVHPTLI